MEDLHSSLNHNPVLDLVMLVEEGGEEVVLVLGRTETVPEVGVGSIYFVRIANFPLPPLVLILFGQPEVLCVCVFCLGR